MPGFFNKTAYTPYLGQGMLPMGAMAVAYSLTQTIFKASNQVSDDLALDDESSFQRNLKRTLNSIITSFAIDIWFEMSKDLKLPSAARVGVVGMFSIAYGALDWNRIDGEIKKEIENNCFYYDDFTPLLRSGQLKKQRSLENTLFRTASSVIYASTLECNSLKPGSAP